MDNVLEKAFLLEQQAWNVIADLNLLDIWKGAGATPHIIGSLKTGLMINKKDIDVHIYSDPLTLEGSFAAISQIAKHRGIKKINYINSLDSDEKCIEWHAWYENTDRQIWQIDMIHIMKESPYAGYFEKVAQRISEVLTPETKRAILEIKSQITPQQNIMGIEVYQAVIRDGITNMEQFVSWKENNRSEEIIDWMP